MPTSDLIFLLIDQPCSSVQTQATLGDLQQRRLPYEVVEAIDGNAVVLPITGICPDRFRRCHGAPLQPNDVGRYLSHLKALRAFLQSTREFAVVVENDAMFTAGALDVIGRLAEARLLAFDLVRLQGSQRGIGLKTHQLGRTHTVRLMLSTGRGSTAYAVSRAGAERLLARLLPMEVPFDRALDRALHLALRMGQVCPPVAYGSANKTCATAAALAAHGDEPSRFEKLEAVLWHAETAIARVIGGLLTYARLKLFERKPNDRSLSRAVLSEVAVLQTTSIDS